MANTDYIAKRGQSLFDIAIETQGDITAIFDLVELNGISGISENISEGDAIATPLSVAAPRVVSRNAALMPIATLTVDSTDLGIGEMVIENTFIIR